MKSKGMTLEREFNKLKKKLQKAVGVIGYTHHAFFVLPSDKNDRRLTYQHNTNTRKSHMIFIRFFSIPGPVNEQKMTEYVMQKIELFNFTGQMGIFHTFTHF